MTSEGPRSKTERPNTVENSEPAKVRSAELEAGDLRHEQQLAARYGLDDVAMEKITPQQLFKRILDVWTVVPSNADEREDIEDVKFYAINKAVEIIFTHKDILGPLFEAVELNSDSSLEHVFALRKILETVLQKSRETINEHTDVISRIYYDLKSISEDIQAAARDNRFIDSCRAFATTEFVNIARDFDGEILPQEDVDIYEPFEIFPGCYGYFSGDERRVFCVLESNQPELYNKIYALKNKKSTDEERGFENIRRNFGGKREVDYEMEDTTNQMIDLGDELEDILKDLGIENKKDTAAHSMFLHSAFRNVFAEMFSYVGENEDGVKGRFMLKLSYFNLVEQFHIVSFLRKLTIKDAPKITCLFDNYFHKGVRALLATEEYEDPFGPDGFITIINQTHETGYLFNKQAIDKYLSIVDEMYNLDVFFAENELGELTQDERNKFAKIIRKRAADIFVRSLKNRNYQELSTIHSDNVLLAEMYKALKAESKINQMEDLAEIKILKGDPQDPRVLDLYKQSYQNPVRAQNLYNKMLQDSTKPGFKSQVVEYRGQIVGAVYVVEDMKNKKVYVGGLNSNESEGLKTLRAGEYIMHNLEERYFVEGWTVEATALLRLAGIHIMKRGFIGVEDLGLSEDGERRLRLLRNEGWKFDSKNKSIFSQSKIIDMAESGQTEKNGEIAVYITKDQNALPEQLKAGYVITQMFPKEDKIYFLLEKKDTIDGV